MIVWYYDSMTSMIVMSGLHTRSSTWAVKSSLFHRETFSKFYDLQQNFW